MSNAPANEFRSTYRPLTVLPPAKDLAACLSRLFRIGMAATAGALRERALRGTERHLPQADTSYDRLHRDVLRIEARRLL